jgi:hypothetical protein
VERRQQNLLVRSLDDDPHNEAHRSIYEKVRAELAEEYERLTRELARVRVRLDRVARILMMALEIAGCVTLAFAADTDPDYRGLISRAIFKELRMRDGEIVGAKASTPLAFFRRWAGEKPLDHFSDLALLCVPNSPLLDGREMCRERHASLVTIRKDLVRLEKLLTPQEEAEIESCYCELRGQKLLLRPYDNIETQTDTKPLDL